VEQKEVQVSDFAKPFAIKFIQATEEQLLIKKEREIERLTRENEELRKDAERYRWIRTAGAWESEIGMDILSEDPIKFDRAVDDYLDAALAKQEVKDE